MQYITFALICFNTNDHIYIFPRLLYQEAMHLFNVSNLGHCGTPGNTKNVYSRLVGELIVDLFSVSYSNEWNSKYTHCMADVIIFIRWPHCFKTVNTEQANKTSFVYVRYLVNNDIKT